jgi:hypothetical protein
VSSTAIPIFSLVEALVVALEALQIDNATLILLNRA